MARDFSVIASTLPGCLDPSVAIAAARAGGIGVLDLEHATIDSESLAAIATIARRPRGRVGVKLDGSDADVLAGCLSAVSANIDVVILTRPHPAAGAFVHELKRRGVTVLIEVTCGVHADIAEGSGADGVIAKGHEAGGWVGDETTFILVQRLIARRLSVWAHGGIGRHSAAACFAAGAAGIVIDCQLALTSESPLDETARAILGRLDGSETICIGAELGAPCRVLFRPGCAAVTELRRSAADLASGDEAALNTWRRHVRARIGWQSLEHNLWLVGQDVAFADRFAKDCGTVAGVVAALHHANPL